MCSDASRAAMLASRVRGPATFGVESWHRSRPGAATLAADFDGVQASDRSRERSSRFNGRRRTISGRRRREPSRRRPFAVSLHANTQARDANLSPRAIIHKARAEPVVKVRAHVCAPRQRARVEAPRAPTCAQSARPLASGGMSHLASWQPDAPRGASCSSRSRAMDPREAGGGLLLLVRRDLDPNNAVARAPSLPYHVPTRACRRVTATPVGSPARWSSDQPSRRATDA